MKTIYTFLPIFFLPFLTSFVISFAIIKCSKYLEQTLDHNNGPQKFHEGLIPRVGGVALIIGIFSAYLYVYIHRKTFSKEFTLLLVSSIPVFLGGLLEDLTKKITPKIRLLTAMLSAGIGFLILGASVPRLDIPFFDKFFVYLPVSFLFTVLAVAGVTNGINIIDGYNGLASIISLFMFIASGYVAYKVEDYFLLTFCFAVVGAIVGFSLWNYPKGLIFLGDGGAYLLGFFISEVLILLVNNHCEISAWFPALVVVYPTFETIFSIYRRRILRKQVSTKPDILHLHHLIYSRVVCKIVNSNSGINKNSLVSIYLWAISLISIIPSMIFWKNSLVLFIFFLLFIAIYLWIYRSIVKFKTPKFLLPKVKNI